jgi:hypothetical protein
MLKYQWLVYPFCLFLFATAIALLILREKREDHAIYAELISSSEPALVEEDAAHYTRFHVCKEIWSQENPSLYCSIASHQSDLFFLKREKEFIALEKLQKVECVMQEELYYLLPGGEEAIFSNGQIKLRKEPERPLNYKKEELIPMQIVRRIVADQASYNYNSHLFSAEKVLLWKYRLPGHAPVYSFEAHSPLIEAAAQNIEFVIQGGRLDFKAQEMKAKWVEKEILSL